MMRRKNGVLEKSTALIGLLFLLALAACGGGGGGGDTTSTTTLNNPSPPSVDPTGTWSITETMGQNTCGETPGVITDQYSAGVAMNGNNITVNIRGLNFTGQISGNKLWWTGSFPDGGGTTTITSMDLTVTQSGNTLSLSGTANWTWSDGSTTCSGSTNISGTAQVAGGGSGGGSGGGGSGGGTGITGTWEVIETVTSDTCGSTGFTDYYQSSVTQNGNTVTIQGASTYTGTLSGNQMSWSGSYPEQGGTTTFNATVTFSQNNTQYSGSANWTWTDGVDTCTGTSSLQGVHL